MGKRITTVVLVTVVIFLLYPQLPMLKGDCLPRRSSPPGVVWAEGDLPPVGDDEGKEPPPPDDGEDSEGEGDGGGNPIQRIFKTIMHVINFPTEALAETIDRLIEGYINGALEGFQESLEQLFSHTVLSSPDLEADPFASAWGSMRNVAMILWPMTLGIIVLLSSHRTVTASAWALADVKEEIAGWFLSVVFSFFSLYICNLFNRLSLGMTEMIMMAGFGAQLTVGGLARLLLAGWSFLEIVPKEGGILLALLLLAIALAVILALVFQYIARYTVLFVLVALAPIAITLGVLSPLRWLKWMWIKGFILVTLIGPINALILKLIAAMSLATGGSGFLGALSGFLITIGLASILITLDSTIIKMVFAGAIAVAEQLKKSAVAVAGMGAAAISLAAGFAPGAGLAAGGTAASRGGGGATSLSGSFPAVPLTGGGGSAGGLSRALSRGLSQTQGGRGAGSSRSFAGSSHAGLGVQAGPGSGGMRMILVLQEHTTGRGQQQRERRAGALQRAGRILRSAFRPGTFGGLAGAGLSEIGSAMQPQPGEAGGKLGGRPSRFSELQGMAARLGVSPGSEQGRKITGALALVESNYGPNTLRRAAGRALGPIATARRDYLPFESMAQEEGFADVGSFVGGVMEDQIDQNGDAQGRPRIFHREHNPALRPPHGAAPGWQDYKAGWFIAEAMGAPDTRQARLYAGLYHAFRDPQYGGLSQGRELVQAAYNARDAAGPNPLEVRSVFTQWVNERQEGSHIPDSHLPREWIRNRGA